MERALLERCPNTLLRRRVSEGFKVSDLALPNRGLRPITTIASPTSTTPTPTTTSRTPGASVVAAAAPRYTSLAEIIPSECASPVESVSSPRTPMRNQLVEKAARAYLRPSDSFNKSRLNHPGGHLSSSGSCALPWTQSFSRFLPRLSVITTALNPFHAFNSAFQVFRFYVTGALAIQPAVATRTVSRSFSMPIQRMSYNHADLSLR